MTEEQIIKILHVYRNVHRFEKFCEEKQREDFGFAYGERRGMIEIIEAMGYVVETDRAENGYTYALWKNGKGYMLDEENNVKALSITKN